MSKGKRISPERFMRDLQQQARMARALLTEDEIARIATMVAMAEMHFDSCPLDDDERQLLASSGAMLMLATINRDPHYIGMLVRSPYTAGILRERGVHAPLVDESRAPTTR